MVCILNSSHAQDTVYCSIVKAKSKSYEPSEQSSNVLRDADEHNDSNIFKSVQTEIAVQSSDMEA